MSANERRQNLLAELFSSRHDTCENLARKMNVTTRTIYSDIELLMCSYPIEAVRGRYGGVKVSDWFYPIVRPDPDGGYEIISGHRRHHAAELAELDAIPVIVRELDDDAAADQFLRLFRVESPEEGQCVASSIWLILSA